jgi:hypothetical protein
MVLGILSAGVVGGFVGWTMNTNVDNTESFTIEMVDGETLTFNNGIVTGKLAHPVHVLNALLGKDNITVFDDISGKRYKLDRVIPENYKIYGIPENRRHYAAAFFLSSNATGELLMHQENDEGPLSYRYLRRSTKDESSSSTCSIS